MTRKTELASDSICQRALDRREQAGPTHVGRPHDRPAPREIALKSNVLKKLLGRLWTGTASANRDRSITHAHTRCTGLCARGSAQARRGEVECEIVDENARDRAENLRDRTRCARTGGRAQKG